MKKLLWSILLMSFLVACQQAPKEHLTKNKASEFQLLGKVSGFEDSTLLMLSINNIDVDSAYVQNDTFSFKGIIDYPSLAFIKTRPLFTFKSLYVCPGVSKISGVASNFKAAKVEGCSAEDEVAVLRAMEDRAEKQIDSLTAVVMNMVRNGKKLSDEEKLGFRQEMEQLEARKQTLYYDFFERYPASYVSLNTLELYNTTWDKKMVRELLEKLDTRFEGTPQWENIQRFLRVNKDVSLDQPMADFTQPDTSGNAIRLSKVKDQYTLLEFWASNCAPCRAENPDMVRMYKQYSDYGFEIVGVSLDQQKKEWIKAINQDKLPWVNVSDLKGNQNDAALIYGVNAMPSNFLIDPSGIIVDKDLRGDKLEKKLAELFLKEN